MSTLLSSFASLHQQQKKTFWNFRQLRSIDKSFVYKYYKRKNCKQKFTTMHNQTPSSSSSSIRPFLSFSISTYCVHRTVIRVMNYAKNGFNVHIWLSSYHWLDYMAAREKKIIIFRHNKDLSAFTHTHTHFTFHAFSLSSHSDPRRTKKIMMCQMIIFSIIFFPFREFQSIKFFW